MALRESRFVCLFVCFFVEITQTNAFLLDEKLAVPLTGRQLGLCVCIVWHLVGSD